jgi:hypothetical protein
MTTRTVQSITVNGVTTTIEATDNPEFNANHSYKVTVTNDETGETTNETTINFQKGPVTETGSNGIQHDALIAILIDRLNSFQDSPFASRENALTLTKIQEAQMWSEARTKDRLQRNVEGTSKQ